MQTRSWAILSVVTASAVFLSGCALLMSGEAPPKRRVTNIDYVGQQSVKYLVNKYTATTKEQKSTKEVLESGEAETVQTTLYNLSVEICDIDANRDEANCDSTNVLQAINLTPPATSSEEEEYVPVPNERYVTSLYWYNPQTLYVAYLDVGKNVREGSGPTPRVKECTVQANNSLSCSSADDVNSKLFIQTTETQTMGGGGSN
jgi:hypothetical protein